MSNPYPTGTAGNDTITGVVLPLGGPPLSERLDGLAGNDSINGMGGSDTLVGGTGDDTVIGGGSADLIYGGEGNDCLYGGGGDDFIDAGTGGGFADGGAGTDTLDADFSHLSGTLGSHIVFDAANSTVVGRRFMPLPTPHHDTFTAFQFANIERFRITGSGGNDRLIGGTAADYLVGGLGDDSIEGNGGNDTLHGGAGNDSIWGGAGSDIVNMETGGGYANGGTSFDAVTIPGQPPQIRLFAHLDTLSADFSDRAEGVRFSANEGTVVIGSTTVLQHELFEVFYAKGGMGNNTLEGGSYADTLVGGPGNDFLNGGAGADVLSGGTGNDEYIVDNPLDVVDEAVTGGIDTVAASLNYTLPIQVENLRLTRGMPLEGTGNAMDNHISGNAAANVLSGLGGNDTLNGGAGADTMTGGLGDDRYVVDENGDVITETAGGGTDTVVSNISRTLGVHQEILQLAGTANINASGNAVDNKLFGNSGANELLGGPGNDTMAGGAGNDVYGVDAAGDVIVEGADGGTDTVRAWVSRVLGPNLENLVLTEPAGHANGTGNALANRLEGNAGNNALSGGAGNDTLIGSNLIPKLVLSEYDTLTGGAGNDLFVLGRPGGRFYDNMDPATPGNVSYALITDFSAGDKLQIKGAASGYFLAPMPAGFPAGQGLFHDSNNNGSRNPADELIAIIQGPNAANALAGAVVV